MYRLPMKSLPRGVVRRFCCSSPPQIKNKHLWRPQCYINGKWIDGEKKSTFPVYNPANGKILANVPRMGVEEAELCGKSNHAAFETFKNTTCKERHRILNAMVNLMTKYEDDLAHIITLEAGKHLAEARGEVLYAKSFLEYYAEEAKRNLGDFIPAPLPGRKMVSMRMPVGPCVLVTPWNFPLAMITRKVGPALAAGCTVTIKPAEDTPLSALAMCALAEEAGLPAGVMNCMTVAREDVVDVGTTFCHDPNFRKLSFTGSTNVGKWLMKESASTCKRISLENGGNAPFIVFGDADLDVALQALMLAKFRNSGQTCVSANRIFVHASIYDKFAKMLTEKVSALVVGDGLTPGVSIGPLINAKGLAKVAAHVQDCVTHGAKVLCGGSPHHELNNAGGCFYLPTVLSGVTKNMMPYYDETFGPVAPLIKFETEAEVIAMANDTRSGLAGYVCTQDLSRAWRMSDVLEVGMLGINEGGISSELAPFGGVKESGIGREGSYQGLREFSEDKYLCIGLVKNKK